MAIIQSIDDMIFIIDKSGLIVFESPSIHRILGYEKDYFIGKTPFTLIHQDDLELLRNELQKVNEKTNEGIPSAFRLKKADNEWVWLEAIASNQLDIEVSSQKLSDGSYQLFMRDITDRKTSELALKDSEERYRSIYENTSIGIYRTNPEGKVLMANPAIIKMLGYDSFEELSSAIDLEDEEYAEFINRKHYLELLEKEGVVKNAIYQWRRRDGKTIYVCEDAKAYKNEDGTMNYFEGTVEDITERELSRQALQKSEESLRAFLDYSLMAVSMTDENGNIVEWNPASERMSSISKDEANGKPLWDILLLLAPADNKFNEELRENAKRDLLEGLKTGKSPFDGFKEMMYFKKDGTKCINRQLVFPIKTHKGFCFAVMSEDVTELKQMEKLLKEKEELHRKLIYSVPDLIIQTDIDGSITFVNESYFSSMPYLLKEDILGKNMLSFIVEKDIERAVENTKLMFENPLGVKEYQLLLNDGTIIDSEVNGDVLRDENDNPIGMVYVVRDITERKKTEQLLLESKRVIQQEQEFNRLLLDTSPVFIVAIDFEGKTLMMNRSLLEALEYTDKEVIDKDYFNTFVPEADHESLNKVFQRIINDEESTINENRIISKSGKEFLVQWHGQVAALDNKKNFFVGFGVDITKSKQSEIALRENEERYRLLFETSNDSIFLMKDDIFLSCNDKTLSLFKCEKKDILDHSPYVFSPEHQPDGRKSTEAALEKIDLALQGKPQVFEWVHKCFDGTLFDAEVSLNKVELHNDTFLQAIVRDISERKKAEQKIKKLNEELERKVVERTAELNDAIATIEISNIELKALNESMASEAVKLLELNEKLAISEQELITANNTKDKFFSIIAHDLRNPIGSIKNILETFKLYYSRMTSEEVTKMIETLYKASESAYDLLENLLYWARVQTNRIDFSPETRVLFCDVDKCINSVKTLSDNKKITIIQNVPKDIIANYDLFFINTILGNLLTNAIKYSHLAGKIEIGVLFETDSIKSEIINSIDNPMITLFVKDYGVGISQRIKDGLFRIDQNVTTAGTANEKGTGLGLILSKEFVDKQGGKIWVESELGKGSIFYFTLPLAT